MLTKATNAQFIWLVDVFTLISENDMIALPILSFDQWHRGYIEYKKKIKINNNTLQQCVSSDYVFYLKSGRKMRIFFGMEIARFNKFFGNCEFGKTVMVLDNTLAHDTLMNAAFNLKRKLFLCVNSAGMRWRTRYVDVIQKCRSKWFTMQNSTIIPLIRLIPPKSNCQKKKKTKKLETVWCL